MQIQSPLSFDPDVSEIHDLIALEKELFNAGDKRSEVIRIALDYLWMHEIIELDYKVPVSRMLESTF